MQYFTYGNSYMLYIASYEITDSKWKFFHFLNCNVLLSWILALLKHNPGNKHTVAYLARLFSCYFEAFLSIIKLNMACCLLFYVLKNEYSYGNNNKHPELYQVYVLV